MTTEGVIIDKCVDNDHVSKSECGLADQVRENIKMLLHRNNLKVYDLAGIGIGCAGHIRFKEGVVITTSNLKGYKCYPLRDAINKDFNIPVILDNDANAQALGEFLFGAGKGFTDMVFMTISTGIGAGIIIDKRLYRGMTGTAGEFGHTIIEPDSDLTCTCGNRGCLMAVACGMALPHLFLKKINSGESSKLALPVDFDYSTIDGKMIKHGLDIGDPISEAIVAESGRYVGIGLYNIFQALNPPLIVLGGGLLSWVIYTWTK